MKKLITMCLVVMLVFGITGSTFAGGPPSSGGGGGKGGSSSSSNQDQGQNQNQNQGQGQGQIQGQLIDNIGNSPVTIEGSNYEEKAGVVAPYGVGLPWQMPTRNNLWNDLAVNPKVLEGPWTMKEVSRPLKKTGKWFVEYGAGFECIASFPRCSARTNTINFKEASSVTIAELTKDYHFIGVVNVRANKDLTYFLGIMHGLKVAMKNGGDLAVLSGGMNTIYHGTSFGLGFSSVNVSQNNSVSGGTGIGSGDAKAQGESAVRLAVFKKNGTVEAIVVDEPVVIEETSEIAEVDEGVNPEILAEVTK